jgi:gas vesicle protein
MNKFLITLLTGVAIGVLIAPAKGAETRRKLVNRFNDLTEDLSDEVNDLYNSGKSLLAEVKTDASSLREEFENIN